MAKTKGEDPAKNKEKVPVKAEEETWAKVKEEAARANTEEEARVKAEQEAQVKAEQEAQVKAEQEARVWAEQEARAKAEQEAQAKSEHEIVRFQEFGKEQLEPAATAATFLATIFETIAAEATDYSKKSLENVSAFVAKLLGANSFVSAIQIQSEYVKTSHTDFIAYLTKIGELYSMLAKEAFKRRSHVA
jgi:membrane protein involved in colicin uptake